MDPAQQAQRELSSLVLDDGARLAYRDAGTGRPLLLLHGWGVSGIAFDKLAETLAPRYRLIVPDLRGHGGSDPFEPEHGFGRLADDVAALLETLAVQNVCVLGWSMGALVAWDLATRRAPSRLSGVVSVDMVPRLLSTVDWPHGLRDGEGPEAFARSMGAMRADWSAFTRVFVPRIFATPPADDDPSLRLLYRAARGNDGAVLARVWAAMAGVDLRDALPGITVPTAHFYGHRSRLYAPAAARWVGAALGATRTVGFEASGHAPHLEEPGAFADALVQFTTETAEEAVRDSRPAG